MSLKWTILAEIYREHIFPRHPHIFPQHFKSYQNRSLKHLFELKMYSTEESHCYDLKYCINAMFTEKHHDGVAAAVCRASCPDNYITVRMETWTTFPNPRVFNTTHPLFREHCSSGRLATQAKLTHRPFLGQQRLDWINTDILHLVLHARSHHIAASNGLLRPIHGYSTKKRKGPITARPRPRPRPWPWPQLAQTNSPKSNSSSI